MPTVRYAAALNNEPVRPNIVVIRPSSGARRQIVSKIRHRVSAASPTTVIHSSVSP
jgi:hypothetical protein